MNKEYLRQAVFLDRDGTINEDVGDLYEIEKLKFIPNSIDAMKHLQYNFLLFIVTNQTGIARGHFTLEQYNKFNEQFLKILHDKGVLIQKSFCCPHLIEDGCVCRKPSIHFLKQAEKEFAVDLTKSFTIGDHASDIELGLNAGAKTVYVLTGHGSKHLNGLEVKPHHICNDLSGAAVWILNSSPRLPSLYMKRRG